MGDIEKAMREAKIAKAVDNPLSNAAEVVHMLGNELRQKSKELNS